MEFNFGKTDNYFNVLSRKYQNNGEVTWSKFKQDQKLYKGKVVIVNQNDFKYGTLRVQQPCMIKLSENINFNPNRPETWIDSNNNVTNDFQQAVSIDPNRKLDWWPDFKLEENKEYFEKEVRNAYRLGFFAAIAVEGEDIILNLNNYTIQQHPEHALQQRFFSVIELADQPFIPKQGPADFGKVLRSATNLAIINGKIGLSSHHGIHGNGNNNILIKNVDFIDNEVNAITLNGATDAFIVNTNVVRNRHDIPVLGTYSAGRFLKLFTRDLENAISVKHDTYNDALVELNNDLDKTFNAVILNKGNVPDIYKNVTGLIDGNYYGININHFGVAVNAPLLDRKSVKANETCNVYIKSVSINNIKTNINEIPVLRNKDGNIMTAPSGAVYQFMVSHKYIDGKYFYSGNSLSDVQIEIVELLKNNQNIKNFLGNFNLDEGLYIWKNSKSSYFTHDYNRLVGHGDLANHNYDIIGNGDSMFHVNKGTFGLKVDGLNTSLIDNLTISNISTISKEGTTLAGNYQKSHPKQNQLNGYTGNSIFGISLNASNDITLENININGLSSKTGSAYGFDLNGESIKINLKNSIIEDVVSCQINYDPAKPYYPNLPTKSRGVIVNNNCGLTINNLNIRDVVETPESINPSNCEFYSIVKTIN
jgi:hypothetical protein